MANIDLFILLNYHDKSELFKKYEKMPYVENIRTFVRIYELGNMSAAARALRISPAVASARISQLEDHLGVKLFQRTTRKLHATEQGSIFYRGASDILGTIENAEAQVQKFTQEPRGSIYLATPFAIGRNFIAPVLPIFKEKYPMITVRMRLSDRSVDLAEEGLDMAFFLGNPKDSTLKMKKIAECKRLLCASPVYIEKNGEPSDALDLTDGTHACLQLRFPGTPEYNWPLVTSHGIQTFAVKGPFESDDGDILTNWALAGHGIVMKPYFEVKEHLKTGSLQQVLPAYPPVSVQLCCLYPHRKQQDMKTRLLIDFLTREISKSLEE